MNTLIKLRVGLKGQLNHVSSLIKATSLREHRCMGKDYWKDTHTISNIKHFVKHFENQDGRESGIPLIKLMVNWLSNVSGL